MNCLTSAKYRGIFNSKADDVIFATTFESSAKKKFIYLYIFDREKKNSCQLLLPEVRKRRKKRMKEEREKIYCKILRNFVIEFISISKIISPLSLFSSSLINRLN